MLKIREATINDLTELLKLYTQLHDNPFPVIDDKINIYVPKKYFYVLNDILVNFV